MRKCVRCNIIYHTRARVMCLYCDAQLLPVDFEGVFREQAKEEIQSQAAQFIDTTNIQGVQYLISNYFRVRSFAFIYGFYRNQLLLGDRFRRFLVEPIRLVSFIKIPWLVINLLDSVLVRMFYQNYCPTCDWKYKRISGADEHTTEECLYNKNYSELVRAILSGSIAREESRFQDFSVKGKSPYRQLCTRRKKFEEVIDVLTIMVSLGLYIWAITALGMTMIGDFNILEWMLN